MTNPAPRALALVCTLTPLPEPSSSQLMAEQMLAALAEHGVTGERCAWWTSVAQRVLERLDAELSETDDEGRLLTYGKVAIVAVVGNEDGAHKVTADLYQALSDVGFTVPAQGGVYWNGEAMTGTDYKDLEKVPEAVASQQQTGAANAVHLATVLRENRYPAT